MYAIGRLAPGATVENAVAELSTIARNEELKNGMVNTSMTVVATPLMTHFLGPLVRRCSRSPAPPVRCC
jgi:hypothetical protein